MSWWQLTRLGFVQAAIGAVVVLLTTTINRVIVVELGLPASVPGLLVALHFGVQLALRPRLGHDSDRSGAPDAVDRRGNDPSARSPVSRWPRACRSCATTPRSASSSPPLPSIALGAGVSASGTPLLAHDERARASVPARGRGGDHMDPDDRRHHHHCGDLGCAARSVLVHAPAWRSPAGIGGAGVVVTLVATHGVERRAIALSNHATSALPAPTGGVSRRAAHGVG